jgi:ankyrin repeat protein
MPQIFKKSMFPFYSFKGCDVNYNGTGYLRKVRTENVTIFVSGLTALHLASDSGHVKFVKKLLTIPGIIVDPTCDDGNTPLFIAARRGNTKILRMLHDAGGDIHALDRFGFLQINIAAVYGNLDQDTY